MEEAWTACLHLEPFYHRAELDARQLWRQRGSLRRAAQGGDHRPRAGHCGQAPDRPARDQRGWLTHFLAALHHAPGVARARNPSRARVHPANTTHRCLGVRKRRAGYRAAVEHWLLTSTEQAYAKRTYGNQMVTDRKSTR